MTYQHEPVHRAGSHNGAGSTQTLQDEIARQRQALADTVTDLQARLDVRSRARHRFEELKDRATTADGHPRPEVKAAAAVGTGVLAGLFVRKVRRHRHKGEE